MYVSLDQFKGPMATTVIMGCMLVGTKTLRLSSIRSSGLQCEKENGDKDALRARSSIDKGLSMVQRSR